MYKILKLLLVTLVMVVTPAGLCAEMPSQVTVSLPVSASVEDATLDPGAYTMVIEDFDGSKAIVKIYREGTSTVRVTAPVTAFQAAEPAPRNAVKVTARNGSYYLDKLVLAGQKTGFQFRLQPKS